MDLGTRVLGGRDILCPCLSLPLVTTPPACEPQGAVLCLVRLFNEPLSSLSVSCPSSPLSSVFPPCPPDSCYPLQRYYADFLYPPELSARLSDLTLEGEQSSASDPQTPGTLV
ncbi:unnamed protein product [Pipistrellus nathusii]|uniref:Uncharacterized protein n=1 Tax=Pipistrellus nathusii TaxID=59473 RepID=A0ABP0AJ85_PIPNA